MTMHVQSHGRRINTIFLFGSDQECFLPPTMEECYNLSLKIGT